MPVCRHPDIQKFDGLRCCLSCGEAIFEDVSELEDHSEVAVSTNYRYRRLNYELGQEIRLIILYPGKEMEDVTCDIVHVNLLDKPVYEAVSYTWATVDGDVSFSGNVTCRGKQIAITMNCESVLRSLRRLGRNRKIWVDAICIDQENTAERNHQVKLMATIYSNASQVLAYLSTATSASLNKVIGHLDGSSDQLRKQTDAQNHYDVAKFLSMSYFDRVWVLQEIALAKIVTLVVGEKTLRWTADTVSILLSLCTTLSIQPPSVLRWLPASQPEAEDLLDVLQRSRNCSTTDKRDKVYALLGLVSQDVANAIPVDYSRAPYEIFTDVAIYLLEERGRVDVVVHALCEQKDTSFVPSWVPEWDVKSGFECLPPQFTFTQVETLASSWHPRSSIGLNRERRKEQKATDFPLDFRFEIVDRCTFPPESVKSQPSSLRTRRRFFDTTRRSVLMSGKEKVSVRAHGQPEHSLHTPPCLRIRAHRLDTIKIILPMVVKERELILPREMPEAFCNRDACSECLLRAFSTTDLDVASRSYQELGHTTYDSQAETKRVEQQQREAFKDMVRCLGNGKTPFVTQSSMGFAQEWRYGEFIRGSDTVWALAGLAVPVILRRVRDHYVLIGECYLFRAALPFLCAYCGAEARSWPMATEVIDIW